MRSSRSTGLSARTAIFALSLIILTVPAVASAQTVVPSPTVSGPVTGGVRTGEPLNASLFDLSHNEYVEEEFFFGGTATDYSGDGAAPAAYQSRVIVRRPADPARFNGTVVMEWYNVTLGMDFEAHWPYLAEQILRSGYAYVGVSAQLVGVTNTRNWDPVRYGSLAHPGDDYSWDIFSQAAQAVRAPAGIDPMGGLSVERILASGDSQSASRLDTYIDDVVPQIVPVIDGFFVQVGGGPFRPDLDVPVFHLQSENEAGFDQADSAFHVHWEIAGAAHATRFQQRYGGLVFERDYGAPSPFDNDNPTCLLSRFPKFLAEHAALEHLDAWVKDGVMPPTAPLIEQDAGAIVRDEHGNARGGVRLPHIEVPVARYDGTITSCGTLGGETEFFGQAKLDTLYESLEDYQAQLLTAAEQAVAQGYMVAPDQHLCLDYQFGDDLFFRPEDDCDGDGVADMVDNCRHTPNPGGEDDGGVDSTVADGIGNACQCGDVSGNGTVNGQDANAIKRHGLGLEPNELFVDAGNCDVTGNDLCNGQDANAVKRAALGVAAKPVADQRCHNALGLPVPPGL